MVGEPDVVGEPDADVEAEADGEASAVADATSVPVAAVVAVASAVAVAAVVADGAADGVDDAAVDGAALVAVDGLVVAAGLPHAAISSTTASDAPAFWTSPMSRVPPLVMLVDKKCCRVSSATSSFCVDGAGDSPRMLLIGLVEQGTGLVLAHDRCASQDRRHMSSLN